VGLSPPKVKFLVTSLSISTVITDTVAVSTLGR